MPKSFPLIGMTKDANRPQSFAMKQTNEQKTEAEKEVKRKATISITFRKKQATSRKDHRSKCQAFRFIPFTCKQVKDRLHHFDRVYLVIPGLGQIRVGI